MCFSALDFLVGDVDAPLGYIGGVPSIISKAQFAYQEYMQGNVGMFSLCAGRD